jgi:hypothetical protein
MREKVSKLETIRGNKVDRMDCFYHRNIWLGSGGILSSGNMDLCANSDLLVYSDA